MARFAVTNQAKRRDHHGGWTIQACGIAEYYAGEPERAMELLQVAEKDGDPNLRGVAMAYRAMALKKLNRVPEAAQVLQDAEDLLNPALQNASSLYWWGSEHYKLVLEEARQEIGGKER